MDLSSFYSKVKGTQPGDRKLPPVHLWNPESCGEIDIKIDRDGLWFHEGKRITRQPLVDLFSSILKRENDDYFLVTPVEKCRIEVAVAPLRIVNQEVRNPSTPNQIVTLTTEQGLEIEVNAEHPLSLKAIDNAEYPVVHARNNLDALITRNAYYQLSDYLEAFGKDVENQVRGVHNASNIDLTENALGVRSHSEFFVLSELD